MEMNGFASSNGNHAIAQAGDHEKDVTMVQIVHDGIVHHPLGGASYYFRKNFVEYLSDRCTQSRICVHVGAQPNSSPHLGNATTFATAFALAAYLRKQTQKHTQVKFVFVDTAPANNSTKELNGVVYQRSLADTHQLRTYSDSFNHLVDELSAKSGVIYSIDTQDVWKTHRRFVDVLTRVIDKREDLGSKLSPETKTLGIRAPCPVKGCGLADKHGILNDYSITGQIGFVCGMHGTHIVRLRNSIEICRLGFNTPLRNLIRIMLCSYGEEENLSWVMCTGSDYAGFYQDQFLWRVLENARSAPMIVYAPLVVDWSGVKLSKTMYVQDGAYGYLRAAGLEYALDGDRFANNGNGAMALYEEVLSWFESPYKLFRNYSVEYMHKQLLKRGMTLLSQNDI